MAAATQRYPALAASFALHAGVLALALLAFARHPPMGNGDVVPVTLMTSADLPPPAPAVAAPQPAPARDSDAGPAGPAAAAGPGGRAAAAPPAHRGRRPRRSTAKRRRPSRPPAPKPAEAAPALDAAEAADRQAGQGLARARPERLGGQPQCDIEGDQPSAVVRPPGSEPGCQTALQTTTAPGTSSAARRRRCNALGGELQRLWNPNCGAAGRRI